MEPIITKIDMQRSEWCRVLYEEPDPADPLRIPARGCFTSVLPPSCTFEDVIAMMKTWYSPNLPPDLYPWREKEDE